MLNLFDADIRRTMALIGARDIAALDRSLVSIPHPR